MHNQEDEEQEADGSLYAESGSDGTEHENEPEEDTEQDREDEDVTEINHDEIGKQPNWKPRKFLMDR